MTNLARLRASANKNINKHLTVIPNGAAIVLLQEHYFVFETMVLEISVGVYF
jgi:hypothetical protein